MKDDDEFVVTRQQFKTISDSFESMKSIGIRMIISALIFGLCIGYIIGHNI